MHVIQKKIVPQDFLLFNRKVKKLRMNNLAKDKKSQETNKIEAAFTN
jgi:hypothetical protein